MNHYDIGKWYFENDTNMLIYRGLIGDAVKTEEEALTVIKNEIAKDIAEGEIDKAKNEGFTILYYIGFFEPHDTYDFQITINTYISSEYGEDVLVILKNYDSYHKINIHVI